MDLQKETNVEKLKSLAYDQMVALEQTQTNLRLINQRIAELSKETEAVEKK